MRILIIFVLGLSFIVGALASLPAAWLGNFLPQNPWVNLSSLQGSIWQGSAYISLGLGKNTAVFPEPIRWQFKPWRIFQSQPLLTVSHPYLTSPLKITYQDSRLNLGASSLAFPATHLLALGAPFNTLQPRGLLTFKWTELQSTPLYKKHNGIPLAAGQLEMLWEQASVALSPLSPLGRYQVHINKSDIDENNLDKSPSTALLFRVTTLEGALQVQGQGLVDERRFQFNGTARANKGYEGALQGILQFLGNVDASGSSRLSFSF